MRLEEVKKCGLHYIAKTIAETMIGPIETM